MNERIVRLKFEIADYERDIRMLQTRTTKLRADKEVLEEELKTLLDFTEKDIA